MIDIRTMSTPSHIKLFNPGPVEVRQEILDAQTHWMIGHRGKAFETLFERIERNLQKVFFTQQRVYLSTSSGTGLWEAAARNCVSDSPNGGVLATVCGDFSERWADVFERNGKTTTVISVERGQAITPELVRAAITQRSTPFEAIAIVQNETSTGVRNPLAEIVAVVKELSPDTLILVDAVSSLAGDKIEFDALSLDVLLTSSAYNMLFQWFVGLSPDQPVWDHSTFSVNRERMSKHGLMEKFFRGSVVQAIELEASSNEHFSAIALRDAGVRFRHFHEQGQPAR